jgi:hypothetical protein
VGQRSQRSQRSMFIARGLDPQAEFSAKLLRGPHFRDENRRDRNAFTCNPDVRPFANVASRRPKGDNCQHCDWRRRSLVRFYAGCISGGSDLPLRPDRATRRLAKRRSLNSMWRVCSSEVSCVCSTLYGGSDLDVGVLIRPDFNSRMRQLVSR